MGSRRDRHGRGLRGPLAPRTVPLARSGAESFDATVLDALDHLRSHDMSELDDVEFAVEDVPDVNLDGGADVLADAGVPLARTHPRGFAGLSAPVIVLYRRPLETRAHDDEDLTALVEDVVIDRLAHLLGRDPADLDPHFDDRDD